MRLQSTVIIASALTAGSLAFAAEKPSGDEISEIRAIGEPKSCITRSSIRSTDVIDDQTIDFEMRNGDIYRNKLPNKCGGLGFEEAFSYKTSTNRLCSVDIIHVLSQTGGQLDTRGACGLGKFQQIEKIPKAEGED
ncbi:hypothetical protein [Parasphingorhabdus flavimaris]|uniref:DUF3617 family protein n=1 Tax=Parasphingorhabdus flavimaris TaxID=266812 RepID=A0ABX2N369_9SPHN|nr:hypothetical protein [Parasphingorhabdus flavimaris]NVD28161.1 hypothetical protein [Parasphingorhabdus flavimaris]|tara:strand:- start:10882 stop:11289 length:408 start_codon:yes stop_codon:yes gene_type:complete